MHLTIFANGGLVFGESSRDDLIKKCSGKISSQVEKSCRRREIKGKSPARPERGQPGGNESKEQAQAIGKALEEKFSVS